jgi:hypothetical protein
MCAGDALILQTTHAEAGAFLKDFKEGDYDIKAVRRKRSLDANAYFHTLVQKIAERQKLGFDEVKKSLVVDYGTLARDDDGQVIGFKLKSSIDVNKLYRYTKAFKTTVEGGKNFTCYLVYKRSSEMDSKEFSRLLDGTVQECATLGIETLDDIKIKQIMENTKWS